MKNNILASYKNGNYVVVIYKDGTKIRVNEEGVMIPDTYETIDICISKKCNNYCSFCYANCTMDGKHADIMNAKVIENLHPGTEIALNVNSEIHPDMTAFLIKCKELELIPNITVNQRTFVDNYGYFKHLCANNLVYGVGISVDYKSDDFEFSKFLHSVTTFPWKENIVIHVVNGLVKLKMLDSMRALNLNLLILGYKEIGRGKDNMSTYRAIVDTRKLILLNSLPVMVNEGWFANICFDNLAVEQLNVRRLVTNDEWAVSYMGDDGTTSYYIDLVDGVFAASSVESEQKYWAITDDPQEMYEFVYVTSSIQKEYDDMNRRDMEARSLTEKKLSINNHARKVLSGACNGVLSKDVLNDINRTISIGNFSLYENKGFDDVFEAEWDYFDEDKCRVVTISFDFMKPNPFGRKSLEVVVSLCPDDYGGDFNDTNVQYTFTVGYDDDTLDMYDNKYMYHNKRE